MKQNPWEGSYSINTGGGAYIEGDVYTGGGDFINRAFITQEAKPEPPFTWGLPPKPIKFVGRQRLVGALTTAMLDGAGTPLVLEGLPGVGKSSLAYHLIEQRAIQDHFKDGLLWASLGPNPPIEKILTGWTKALGGKEVSENLSYPVRSQIIRDLIGDYAILLVIDDVWEEETAEILLCAGRNSRILLTTRNKTIARKCASAPYLITVPELAADDAESLLNLVAPQAFHTNPALAKSLIEAVGGLPLAITVLGGYLQTQEHGFFSELSPAALTDLEDPAVRLAQAAERIKAPGSGQESLQQILSLSLEGLPAETVAAFHALGAFAPKPALFSRAAAEQVTGAPTKDLAVLGMRNLIERMENGALSIHQVLSDMARTKMDGDAVLRHRDHYLGQLQEDVQDWRRIETIYDQVRAAWEANPDDETLIPFLGAVQTYQRRRGLWQDELDWLKRALAMTEAEDLPHPQASVHYHLGQLHNRLGDKTAALKHARQALANVKAAGDTGAQIQVEQLLGVIYLGTNESEQCFEHFEKAVQLAEDLENQPLLTECLLTLAHANRRHHRYERALALIERVLPLERALENRGGEADALSVQSMALAGLDQREAALERLQEAAEIWKGLKNPAALADLYNGLAKIYLETGRLEAAFDIVKAAFPFWESIGDRSGYAESLTRLGDIQRKTGDLHGALTSYQETLAVRLKIGVPLTIANAYQDVAIAQHELGDYETALETQEAALKIWRANGWLDRLADGYLLLERLFSKADLPARGLPYAQQGLAIWWHLDDQAELALALSQVGQAYFNLDRPDLAVQVFEKELQVRQEVGFPGDRARAHFYAGLVYEEIEQHADAQPHWRSALTIWEAEGDHPNQALAMQKLARNHSKLDESDQAIALFQALINLLETLEDWNELAFSHYFLNWELDFIEKDVEALFHLRRSLELWIKADNLEMVAVAYTQLGHRLQTQEKSDEALDHFARALAYYQSQGDQTNQATILGDIADVHSQTGKIEAAVKHLEKQAALLADLGDPVSQAEALFTIGSLYRGEARFSEAAAIYAQAAEALKGTNYPHLLANALHQQGLSLTMGGHPEKATSALSRALDLWETCGDDLSQAHTLTVLGVTLNSTGHLHGAHDKFKKAISLFDSADDLFELGNTWIWLGINQSELGRIEEAAISLQQAFTVYQELNLPEQIATVAVNLATAYDRLEKPDQARKYAEMAAEILALNQLETLAGPDHYNLGQINLFLGRYEAAVDHYSRALTFFDAAEDLDGLAMTLRRYGVVLFRDGRGEDAIAHLEQSVGMQAGTGKPWLEAHARLDLAKVLQAQGQLESARKEYQRILNLVDDPEDRTVQDAWAALQELEER